jgi:hypothetical protein
MKTIRRGEMRELETMNGPSGWRYTGSKFERVTSMTMVASRAGFANWTARNSVLTKEKGDGFSTCAEVWV